MMVSRQTRELRKNDIIGLQNGLKDILGSGKRLLQRTMEFLKHEKKAKLHESSSCIAKTYLETEKAYYAGEMELLEPLKFSSLHLKGIWCSKNLYLDTTEKSALCMRRAKRRQVIGARLKLIPLKPVLIHLDGSSQSKKIGEKSNVICLNPCMAPYHENCDFTWCVQAPANLAVAVKYMPEEISCTKFERNAIRREILYYVHLGSRLRKVQKRIYAGEITLQERSILGTRHITDWNPVVQMIGYYLNHQNPARCVLVTSLVWGVDLHKWTSIENKILESTTRLQSYEAHCPERLKLARIWIALVLLRKVFQLHKVGFRHNDLKPSNIMLDLVKWRRMLAYNHLSFPGVLTNKIKHFLTSTYQLDMQWIDVKLIDLGNATSCSSQYHSGGTPAYLSPEQLLTEYKASKPSSIVTQTLPLDERTDLWSLGLIITEMLTGRTLLHILQDTQPLRFVGEGHGQNGWMVSPQNYIEFLYQGFFKWSNTSPTKYSNSDICLQHAAQKVFRCFVQEHPDSRQRIEDVMLILLECALQLRGIWSDPFLRAYQRTLPNHLPMWVDSFFAEQLGQQS